jgi:hypothetical protein
LVVRSKRGHTTAVALRRVYVARPTLAMDQVEFWAQCVTQWGGGRGGRGGQSCVSQPHPWPQPAPARASGPNTRRHARW